MPSVAELGVEDVASFFCNYPGRYCYIEVRVMFDHVTCVYMLLYGKCMRRSLVALDGRFQLGQKVNIIGVALTGGSDFGPQ